MLGDEGATRALLGDVFRRFHNVFVGTRNIYSVVAAADLAPASACVAAEAAGLRARG